MILLWSESPVILGLDENSINFSVDYFVSIKTKYVCLLTCGNRNWNREFAKRISTHNIAVSTAYLSNRQKLDFNLIKLCLKQTSLPIGVFINPHCSAFEDVMYYASQNSLLDRNHKWLINEHNKVLHKDLSVMFDEKYVYFEDNNTKTGADNVSDVKTIVDVLNNLNLSVDADITVSIKRDSWRYNLYEFFNFGKCRGGKFVIQNIGNWDVNKGLSLTKTFKYYRRWNFQKMTLRMIVSMNPVPKVFHPEMLLGRIPDPGVAVISQTGAQLLNEIAGIHNFRYTYTVVDRWVGDYNRNHSYAATNALYFREHDITPVLRFLPTHFSRYDVVFPTVTFIETRYYYRIPSYGIGKFENQFLRPLSTATWWCVVAVGALCGIVLMLSAIVEKRPITIDFALFSVLALICQQFFEEFEDIKRISSARKLTILVTGLSCLLIYNYYTSSVVSWLLNGPPPSINSLWELLDSPLQPVFQDTGYSYSWLQLPDYYYNKKNAKAEEVLKKRILNMKKKGNSIIIPVNEGIDLVRKGGYVYHTDVNSANSRISQTFTQKELCDLDSLNSMEKNLLYPCVQKRSPYREFFIWSLSRLMERGIIRCIQQRTWSHGVKCEGSSPRALALGGAAPAFILLAAGYILGTVIMLFERLKWKQEKSRLKRF
ncbi:ionotropic receptor 75a-like [Vanessa cardui]|uniref:ionotropic receptor 75a-like n=1 Tax=Vanessa cardui TaxID=171605 RepID=UPI001F129ABF|nr:ionotropic receptor 75a-like [Vanessa cardui]